MSKEIEVGQVWINNSSNVERTVIFVGNKSVLYFNPDGDEYSWEIKNFIEKHTLKKPEPKVLGRLIMNRDTGVLRLGSVHFDNYIPVTINERGEVLEVRK